MLLINSATPLTPGLPPTNALTTLLTVESLLLAGIASAIALSSTTTLAISAHAAARALVLGQSVVLTCVAVGAAVAWSRVFLADWPQRFDDQVPALCLALGIVAQPVVAWIVVRLLHRR